ncbi:hypothetical protein ACU8KH_06594 [Lachancea thermotolerans]
MDETGVEPMTSPMLRERATNYATRPLLLLIGIFTYYITDIYILVGIKKQNYLNLLKYKRFGIPQLRRVAQQSNANGSVVSEKSRRENKNVTEYCMFYLKRLEPSCQNYFLKGICVGTFQELDCNRGQPWLAPANTGDESSPARLKSSGGIRSQFGTQQVHLCDRDTTRMMKQSYPVHGLIGPKIT